MLYTLAKTFKSVVNRNISEVVKMLKDFRHSIIKALLPHIILSLMQEKPMHGYAIIITIRKKYRPAYFGPSTIYPLLNELEHDGLVQSKWNMGCEGIQRPRKTYEITTKGRAWLVQTDTALESCRPS